MPKVHLRSTLPTHEQNPPECWKTVNRSVSDTALADKCSFLMLLLSAPILLLFARYIKADNNVWRHFRCALFTLFE